MIFSGVFVDFVSTDTHLALKEEKILFILVSLTGVIHTVGLVAVLLSTE